ncbi:MAG: 3-methyl-2-oxobutanoate hydroxymethyltransferase [Lentisphaeria bacterium]|nr:3-methyl-2-oxobutanoate hydroxymethyltransferase [Lentisphaeria bacterium]
MEKRKKLTVSQFRKMKENGEKIVMVTSYDACFAALAEAGNIDMILVGDSVGMTQLGYENTVQVTMDQMVHHCAAVRRGAPDTFIVGDMPFLSCQISEEQAMRNAMRLMQEGFCDAVKIESDTLLAPLIAKMVHAGIPVMGHIGLLPQHIKTSGVYKIQGKSEKAADRLLADAKALEDAGVFSMVIECVPAALAKRITEMISVPTIGIGAGKDCSGQVQVINDILGLSPYTPKHARKHAELAELIKNVISSYTKEVKEGVFPGEENSF